MLVRVTGSETTNDPNTLDAETDALVGEWLTLPDVAERFGVQVTRIRQLLRDNQLLAVRRGENNSLQVPAAFLDGNHTVKGLTGTLTLLRDAKFTEAEAIKWLFTPDDTLPGTPAQALAENRGTEVRRRAQAEL
jgi:hypothetical protein